MAEDLKKDILTIKKTAKLLEVSSRTIYDLISAERIPGKIFGKKVGRSWRIMRKEIDAFLSEEKNPFHQMSLNQKGTKIKMDSCQDV